MRRECREAFLCHWLQRKTLVSDPSMHHGMSGSLPHDGEENVPGACPTRKFTYLARGPCCNCSSLDQLEKQLWRILINGRTALKKTFVSPRQKKAEQSYKHISDVLCVIQLHIAWEIGLRGFYLSIPINPFGAKSFRTCTKLNWVTHWPGRCHCTCNFKSVVTHVTD